LRRFRQLDTLQRVGLDIAFLGYAAEEGVYAANVGTEQPEHGFIAFALGAGDDSVGGQAFGQFYAVLSLFMQGV